MTSEREQHDFITDLTVWEEPVITEKPHAEGRGAGTGLKRNVEHIQELKASCVKVPFKRM